MLSLDLQEQSQNQKFNTQHQKEDSIPHIEVGVPPGDTKEDHTMDQIRIATRKMELPTDNIEAANCADHIRKTYLTQG